MEGVSGLLKTNHAVLKGGVVQEADLVHGRPVVHQNLEAVVDLAAEVSPGLNLARQVAPGLLRKAVALGLPRKAVAPGLLRKSVMRKMTTETCTLLEQTDKWRKVRANVTVYTLHVLFLCTHFMF